MEFQRLINSLERFSRILPATVGQTSPEDATWKPNSTDWSILEIVCHLRDEEIEDFRPRVKMTLETPDQTWPPIDPPAAAIERKYNEQSLAEVLESFLAERQASLDWLRTLSSPAWDHAYQFPNHGPVPAGEIMVSWAAHDHLHLRQITKRLYEINLRDGSPYIAGYAGDW